MSVTSVTSEALQLKLRQLLPSQQGFGTDITASDTIIPVIDLTASAEGSDVRQDLQTAFAFGSQTSYQISNATTDIANSPGFYRVYFQFSSPINNILRIQLTDGATTKILCQGSANTGVAAITNFDDIVVFLNTGETLQGFTDNAGALLTVTVRQIADNNGTLVQPSGFTPQ